MEFSQKLQELRKQKGLTQEKLATSLFVSRTAVAKWESGRGYPSIDSLKAIAEFFSVTLDSLLSSDEFLTLAEADNKRKERAFKDFLFGLLDISAILLFFLPFFAEKTNGAIQSVSLLALYGVRPYLKIFYFIFISATAITGVLTLALQNCQATAWLKIKTPLSLTLGIALALLMIISSQPYAAVFAFSVLAVKALFLIKRQ